MSQNSKNKDVSVFKIPLRYQVFITVIAFLGWTLAYVDYQFFGLLVPKIRPDLHLSLNQISLINSVFGAFSLISSLVLGWLMDTRGRLLPFQITLLFYSIGTALTSAANGFLSLLAARSIVAIGYGPEGLVTSVMVVENSDKRLRGILGGLLLLAVPTGITIASFLTRTLVVSAGLNWRYVFLIGIFPALLVIVARLKAKESARFEGVKKIREEGNQDVKSDIVDTTKVRHHPLRQIFERDLIRKSVVNLLFVILVYGIFSSTLLFITTYLTTAKGIGFGDSLTIVGTASSLSVIGYLAATFIGQAIGRREATIMFGLLGAIFLYLFATSQGFNNVFIFYVLFYVFFASIGPTFVTLFAEMYPTRARGAGQGLNFAAHSIGTAIWPLLLTETVAHMGWDQAIIYVEFIPLVIASLVLLALPRIKPTVELESIAI